MYHYLAGLVVLSTFCIIYNTHVTIKTWQSARRAKLKQATKRKHSRRMRTDRLPTIRPSVATTCQAAVGGSQVNKFEQVSSIGQMSLAGGPVQ